MPFVILAVIDGGGHFRFSSGSRSIVACDNCVAYDRQVLRSGFVHGKFGAEARCCRLTGGAIRSTRRPKGRNRDLTALRVPLIATALAGCLVGAACRQDGDADPLRPSEFGSQAGHATTLVEEGRGAYLTYCVGCHGVAGDGRGEAARFLSPLPRDFQTASFKFSSTRSGRLPTDDDLRRSIRDGLRGSAMPGWDLLPARTIDALIVYIKTFSPRWTGRDPASMIPVVNDPYRKRKDKSAAIARGEAVYHGFATCWTCHPAYVSQGRINQYLAAMENPTREYFRPLLSESEAKPNAEGEVIYPPDFVRDFVRAGAGIDDIYRSIGAGITGTAMPTWIDSMEYKTKDGEVLVDPADVWAMAYYVQSLIISRPPLIPGDRVVVRERPQIIYAPGQKPEPVADPSIGGPDGEAFKEESDEDEDE